MYRCIFCQMLEGKLNHKKLYENEDVYAYLDPNPWAPVHIILFPKKHIGLNQTNEPEYAALRQKLLDAVPEIVSAAGCQDDYELYTEEGEEHATQNREHLHFHIRGNVNAGK